MTSSSIAANTLGTLGAICWSIQLLPQIYQNYRRKDTTGLQPTMMLLWASAGIPLGIYNIVRSFPVALQIQPQILTFLSLVTWAQTQYYPPARDRKPRSVVWCGCVLTVICGVAGGVEVGIIFAMRIATERRTEGEVEYYWPVVLMGVLSAVLLCAGVGRHYVDIWKERTVRGISFLFCFIDALGDLTSLVSVVFWWKAGRSLDVLGLVIYGSELVLWLGVFACGGWYNLRPWVREKIDERESRGVVQRSASGEVPAREGGERTTSQAGSTSSTSTSTVSGASFAPGTAFRTASGRLISGSDVDGEGLHYDTLRMRSIVQA